MCEYRNGLINKLNVLRWSRLSTIQDANKISVVKEGVVVEEGNHEDLMNKQGYYYRLQAQNNSNVN